MLLTGFFIWSLTHVTTLLSQRLNEPIHTLLNYLRSKQNIIKHCLKRHAASLAYCFSCKLSPTYSTYLSHYTATYLLYVYLDDRYHPLPSFSSSPPKIYKLSKFLFLGNFSLYIGFLRTSPHKDRIFQWTPTMLNFLFLTPFHLLKITKFLDEISQFKFLVKADIKIFVYKLLLSLNISDFSLFLCQNCTPPLKKVAPSFPTTLL